MSTLVEQMENEYKEKIRGLHFFDANCCLGRVNNRGPVFMNSVDDENVVIQTEEKETLSIPRKNIARANLEVRF